MSKTSVALFGGGNISDLARQAFQELPDVDVVAVVDPALEVREKASANWKIPAFADADSMMREVIPTAAFLGVPSGARMEPALWCLKQGLLTIAEKPLEITKERLQRVLSAGLSARAAGKGRLFGVFQWELTEAATLLHQAAASGCFGDLVFIQAMVPWFRPKRYYFVDDAMTKRNWRGTWELDGGGALMNQAIHQLNAVIRLAVAVLRLPAGQSPVKSVGGSVAQLVHRGYIEVEDAAHVQMQFTNGAMGSLMTTVAGYPKPGLWHIRILGTKGCATLTENLGITEWELSGTPVDEQVARHRALAAERAAQPSAAVDPKKIGHLLHKAMFTEILAAANDGRASIFDAQNAALAPLVACDFYEAVSARAVLAPAS